MLLEWLGQWMAELAGFVLWLTANVVYLDRKRVGRGGLGRLISFWLGMPTTLLTFFFLPEGTALEVKPPPDDEEALLAEIRRDRRLRSGDEGPPGPPTDPTPPEEP